VNIRNKHVEDKDEIRALGNTKKHILFYFSSKYIETLKDQLNICAKSLRGELGDSDSTQLILKITKQ
jgi:hypothetical protein